GAPGPRGAAAVPPRAPGAFGARGDGRRMSTVDRYLARWLAGGLLIAALVLLPLFAFLDLVEQLDDVGEGFYTAADAFLYVALIQPRRLAQLLPFIVLLGAVVALGRLAAANELTALRAAGLSAGRLGAALLKA